MRMKKGEWKWQNKGKTMKKTAFLLILCLVSALALPLNEISKTMQQNIDKSLLLLKKAPKDKTKVAKELFKMFDPIFDYSLMAKLSLSKSYNKLNDEQKQEFNKVFEEQLKASFTNKLGLYTDEKIQITGIEEKKERVFLNAQMMIDGEIKNIIFKFYDKKGDWLIYDIDVLGVSIIQTYRSQFADLLEKEDFNTFINRLKNTNFELK